MNDVAEALYGLVGLTATLILISLIGGVIITGFALLVNYLMSLV